MSENTEIPITFHDSIYPIVLVGLPGAGKTRVGHALAKKLAVPHFDTDDIIEEIAGKTVSEIFADDGEQYFRKVETQAVANALENNAIVSLGGGAIETSEIRDLIADATVIYIKADLAELLSRVKRNSKRPLLQESPEQVLQQLEDRRGELYSRAAKFSVNTDSSPIHNVVDQILDRLRNGNIIRVNGESPYDVFIGSGTSNNIVDLVPKQVNKILVVHPEELTDYAEKLSALLSKHNLVVDMWAHVNGENAKDLSQATLGWDAIANTGLGRKDLIVTLGGGVTTDLGGFLAATWMRGIDVLHVPTSLLAMVDASVGGKTGINSESGKNLIGSFHNPIAVIADTNYISSLSQREYSAGLGELIKCGFIADPEILDLVAEHPQIGEIRWATSQGLPILENLISRAVAVKATVVSEDLKESGLREILNYGHTLAHAIEKISNYQVRHGEAVAIGCVFAATLSADLGLISPELVQEHIDLFRAVGLPTDTGYKWDDLLPVMFTDKKTRGDKLRFVLLDNRGKAITVPVETDRLEKVWKQIGWPQ